jgi:hypothetical protein
MQQQHRGVLSERTAARLQPQHHQQLGVAVCSGVHDLCICCGLRVCCTLCMHSMLMRVQMCLLNAAAACYYAQFLSTMHCCTPLCCCCCCRCSLSAGEVQLALASKRSAALNMHTSTVPPSCHQFQTSLPRKSAVVLISCRLSAEEVEAALASKRSAVPHTFTLCCYPRVLLVARWCCDYLLL